MATSGSWNISWQSGTWAGTSKYYHWSGNWSKSDTTITLSNQRLWLTLNGSATGTGSGTDSVSTTGGSSQSVTLTFSGGNSSSTASLNNTSFTVDSGSTSSTIYCYISGESTGSTGISYDAAYTSPSTPSVTIAAARQTSVTFNVSISSYGNPSSASGRYIEAAILNQNSYGASYRYATASNTTSSSITVSNSSSGTSGFTITPNTRYYYGGYASNTQRSVSTVTGTFYTLPPTPTISVSAVTATTATVTITTPADGGALSKTVYYRYLSSDIGYISSWISAGTVSGTSASTKTVTLTGLTSNVSYTVMAYSQNSNGGSYGTASATFTTPCASPTVSATGTGFTKGTITITTPADGGAQTKTIQYRWGTSANSGTWTTYGTATGGDANTVTISSSSFSINTTYYVQARVVTSAGTSNLSQTTFTTYQGVTITGTSGNINDGDTPRIDFTGPRSGLVLVCWLSLPNLRDETVANRIAYRTITGTTSSYSWTLSDSEWQTIYDAMTATNSTTIRYHISASDASNDGTASSGVWQEALSSGTITITDANPTFTDFSYADTNSTITDITENDQWLVQNYSTPQVTISESQSATAKKGATIVRYTASLNGTTRTATYNASGVSFTTFGSALGNGTITVRAIDSRGNTTAVTKTAPVVPYSRPDGSIRPTRSGTGNDVTALISGIYSSITVDGVVKNALTGQIRYKSFDSETWNDWEDLTIDISDESWSATRQYELSNVLGWLFEVTVSDKLNTYTITATLVPIFAFYSVNLYLDDVFVGDIRDLAQGLTWTRAKTANGVDTITFRVNDKLANDWAIERGTSLYALLRPLALTCRIVRNTEEVCGGFLASMPDYSPNVTTANLTFNFDGYMNYLAGVYLSPATYSGRLSTLISSWITEAEDRATNAGKGFGLSAGSIESLASVTDTFDDYKTVKEAISQRSDNETGAGKFEVYWHADKSYDIISDSNFGTVRDYIVSYPASQLDPLPDDYTEVEYIESTGSGQYIDTGVAFQDGVDVVVDYENGSNLTVYPFGAGTAFQIVDSYSAKTITAYLGTDSWEVANSSSAGRHHIRLSSFTDTASVDNTRHILSPSTLSDGVNVALFGVMGTSGLGNSQQVRVYHAKIYKDGELVRNFVPCINSDEVVGMYDTVDGKFYADASDSGVTFEAGTQPVRVGVSSISSPVLQGFASSVLGLGAGVTSADADDQTAVTSQDTNADAVTYYGYAESLMQESSISSQSTMDSRVSARLAQKINTQPEPQITFSGRQIAPSASTETDLNIWLGDTISLENNADYSETMSGLFTVDELRVTVSENGSETITPTLTRKDV